MTEQTHSYELHSPWLPSPHNTSGWMRAYRTELVIGTTAAGAAALFVSVHWSIAFLIGVIAFALSVSESGAFLLLSVFLLPLEWTWQWSFPIRDIPVAFRTIVISGFFFGRLLRGQLQISHLLDSVITRLSLLFLCATAVPLLLGIDNLTREAERSLWTLFTCVGFYLVIFSWANSKKRIERVLQMLLLSAIVTALFAILQEINGDYTSLWYFLNPPQEWFAPMSQRAPSFFANPNFLASYLNLLIPFSLAFWLLGGGFWKRLSAWTTSLSVVALLCTQSLGGIVSFGGVVVLAILCFARNRGQKLALLAAVFALAVGYYCAKEILNPAHEGIGFSYDQAIRIILWGIAWNFFSHSPVLGVGWGNFAALYGSYVSNISWIPAGQFEVHNIYLQLLAETGLMGFGTFFLLIFRVVQQASHWLRRSVASLDRALAFGVLGATLTVLLHGFVDFFFQVSPQFGTLYWILLALLVANLKMPHVGTRKAQAQVA